ncbi:hypothetical protein [Vibrio diabolicus]|uniref:hypothetical protein n=1 Tax=Vibrio diabolicus TaxID=50719 RepID=UPI002286C7B3|nr:hypothetical protein [Vibrio diabolicus]MCZ0758148.1 hypothetical protein [Vibrio diabolicus]
MMKIHHFSFAILLIGCSTASFAENQTNTDEKGGEVELLKKVNDTLAANGKEWKWQDFQIDTSPGSISAMGLLGISGDSLFNIENVKDIKLAFEGISTTDSGMGFGIAFTPARSSLFPMDLHTYASGWFYRLIGNTSLGYAEGEADIDSNKFDRRAVSVKTSMYLYGKDDPVIAVARALSEKGEDGEYICQLRLGSNVGDVVSTLPEPTSISDSAKDENDDSEELVRVREDFTTCKDNALKQLRWNRSQLSLAYATGWVKESNGNTSQESLGHSTAVNFLYGFDHFKSTGFNNNFALSLTYQNVVDEPILSTLGSSNVEFKDSDLFTGEIIGGTDRFRVLLQGSNTRSNDITTSQRTFKYAAGLDYKFYSDAWLHFRVGKQRTFDGSDDEVGSLLKVSYSPGALIEKNL